MKFRAIFPVVFLVFAWAGQAFAQTTIKAEVDKTSITTDEFLTYKLTVVSVEKNIPPPKLPEFRGLAVVSQAESSTVSFQRGGMQSVIVFAFILLPQETGKIKIEPAQVRVKGKIYSSEAFQIEVKAGVVRGIPRKEEPGPQIPQSDQPQYTL